MRARRRSARVQSYAPKPYDFEASDAEPAAEAPAARRRKTVAHDDDDADFDGEAAAADGHGTEPSDDDDEGAADDDDAEDDDVPVPRSGPEQQQAAPSRRRARKPPARNPPARAVPLAGRAAHDAPAYRELEPVPSDSHAVKSYVGVHERYLRAQSLIAVWYGPDHDAIAIVQRLLDRWIPWPILPPKLLPPVRARADDPSPLGERHVWLPPGTADRQAELAREWRARVAAPAAAASRILTDRAAAPYMLPERPLPVLVGPYPDQRAVECRPGRAICLSRDGLPLDQDSADNQDGEELDARVPFGWMLDTGGLVVGMDWAPCDPQDPSRSQLLALAVIPHADQEMYDYETEHRKPDFQRHGLVQLWALHGEHLPNGIVRPSARQPSTLRRRLCFDSGRARRVKWSPAGAHLAVLCGDGCVRILDIGDEDTDGAYEKIEQPLATLALRDEEDTLATAMAWATFNRLVIGYSDGSLALWSVYPACMLARHPVHHSVIVSVATGAPTMPYLVASTPLGGSVKLVDVRSPSYETSEVQTNAVNSQPSMLAWSDHLLGFVMAYPSANALNTTIGFAHHRHFPIVRRIFDAECFPSCLAVGRVHPHLLVGASDGALWGLNPQCELFKARRPPQERLRIFLHEHRPPGLMPNSPAAPARGASRVIHGFAKETNLQSTSEGRTPSAKKPPKKAKKKPDGDYDDDDEGVEEDAGGGDEPFSLADPTRGIVHEPLTRVTAVEWNPNPGFGCWAAAALGSGLVRVLDLGLENVDPESPE